MVSESLTLTFSLLTGFYSWQQPSSLWLGDVNFLGMECDEVMRFLRFSQRREHGSAQKFFSEIRRKHLIITTHVEKQCTWALTKYARNSIQVPEDVECVVFYLT